MLSREVAVLGRLAPDQSLRDEVYFSSLEKAVGVARDMFNRVLTTTRDSRGALVFDINEYLFMYSQLKVVRPKYYRENVFELMDWLAVVQSNFRNEPWAAQSLKYVGLHTRILQLGREIKTGFGRSTVITNNDAVRKTIDGSLSILRADQMGDGRVVIDLMNSMTWGCAMVVLSNRSLFSGLELLGHCGALTTSLDYLARTSEKQIAEDGQAADYSWGLTRVVEASKGVLDVVPTFVREDLRDEWSGQPVGGRESVGSRMAMESMLTRLRIVNSSAVDAKARRVNLLKRLADRNGKTMPRDYYLLRDYFLALSESVVKNLIGPSLERLV